MRSVMLQINEYDDDDKLLMVSKTARPILQGQDHKCLDKDHKILVLIDLETITVSRTTFSSKTFSDVYWFS